jgi:LacI family transcriptional regulator
MSLERRFRKYLGHSPHAEIRAVQLARAKQLLVETEHPIHRIAQLVGIEHPEYFNVLFKREVGQPPGQYRQEARAAKLTIPAAAASQSSTGAPTAPPRSP